MGDTFRNFSVYGKSGRKVEFMASATLSGASNAEQIIVDGKVAGSSKAVKTSSANIDAATCVQGKDSTQVLFDLWESGEYVPFTFGMIDGRILTADMMVTSVEYKADAPKGTTQFTCSLVGGGIKKTG